MGLAKTVTVDLKGPMARLDVLVKKTFTVTDNAVELIANELLRLSQFEVPHDKGTLQNSGTVQREANGWVVGYNTVYAARLHEHPEYNFQRGRKGKYLEDPLKRNLEALGLKWSKDVKSNLLG